MADLDNNEVVQYAIENKDSIVDGTVNDQVPTIEPPKFQRPRNVEEFLKMNPEAPETPEQRLQREKRERTNKIIAGVGDMISALSNMYFTTKGAPNAYDPKNSLSGKMQERYDQLNREREIRDKDYRSGLMRAQQLDDQQNLSWENLKRQYARDVSNERLRQQKEAEAKAKAEEAAKKEAAKQEANVKAKEAEDKGDLYGSEYWKAIASGLPHDLADRTATAAANILSKKQHQKGAKVSGRSSNTGKVTTRETYDADGNLIGSTKTYSGPSNGRGNNPRGKSSGEIDYEQYVRK